MKFLKVVLILSVLFINETFAQIGGLSGSKLISYTVDIVDDKNIEFEPAFYHFSSSKKWDSDGNLTGIYSTPDSVRHVTGMGFRFTYGLWNRLETGMSVSTDLEVGAVGLRYVLYQKNKLGLAAMAGVNIPFGNRTLNKKIRLAETTLSAGAGIVGTVDFSENLSLDINAQYMSFLKETEDHDRGKLSFSADVGYYLFHHTFQLIGAAVYSTIKNTSGNHSVLTLDPGFTVETGKNFIIVIGFPFDVYGRNEAKNRGFTFALTITLH